MYAKIWPLPGRAAARCGWSSNNSIPNGRLPLKIPAATADKPGTLELKIVFKANELAEFSLVGDGDTDLDLYIFDAAGWEGGWVNGRVAGRPITKDVDPPATQGGGSDICNCRWQPLVEQEYTILIINYGKVYNLAQAGCN